MFSFRSSHQRYSAKKVFLKKFCKFHRKTPMLESLFNKIPGLQACNFIKKRPPTQAFSCRIYDFFKNTYFEEYLRTTASVVSFSWLSLPRVFSKMVEEWWSQIRHCQNRHCHLHFPQNNYFLH